MLKNPPANAGDARNAGSIPGWRRSPEVGNDNPLQYSCLENSMDGAAWQAIVHGVGKSWTQLSAHTRAHTHTHTSYLKLVRAALYHSVVYHSWQPYGPQFTRALCPPGSPGKNTGAGCLALLQGIVPTQGSNPGLPHRRYILYRWATREAHLKLTIAYKFHSASVTFPSLFSITTW